MHKIKSGLLMIIILFILLQLSPLNSIEKHYNKVISVVFDDSGSMAIDVRWAHANYALQTLVSLLEEGDILYIHFMNASENDIFWEVQNGTPKIEMLDKIKAISIPDVNGDGNTPIESVSIGLERLKSDTHIVVKENVQYENWLVLITDGNEMTDQSNTGYVNYVDDSSFESGFRWIGVLDQKLATILNREDVDYKAVILKIGDTSQDMLLTSSMIGSPLFYKSASVAPDQIANKQIIENMNDISSLISGRLPSDVVLLDGNQLTINSQVPFNELDLLLQNSNSSIQSISDASGKDIPITITTTRLTSPDTLVLGSKTLESDKELFGSSIRLEYLDEEALPSGDYIIRFNESIQNAKITSFCYPSIQFIFEYFVDGKPVEQVFQNDRVTLEFTPVRRGTEEILSDLPLNIEYALEMKCGDQFLSLVDGTLKTNEFIIRDETIEGNLMATIPDVWFWSLNVLETIPIAPETEKPSDRIFTLDISNETSSVTYLGFDEASEVIFKPSLNGESLSPTDFEKASLKVVRVHNSKGSLTDFEYELTKMDGYWTFRPVYSGFKASMPADDFLIEVRFASEAIENVNEYVISEFHYIIEDAPFVVRYFKYILICVILLLLGIYLIGIVIKPRLKIKTHVIEISYFDSIIDLDDPILIEEHPIKINKISRILSPYKREIGRGADLIIKAGKKEDHIYLTKESQKDGMELGNYIIKKDTMGLRELRMNLDQKLEYTVNDKLRIYRYKAK